VTTVDLPIEGMTCASCAARIERKLNRLDGVKATVNYAVEAAHVELAGATTIAVVLEAVDALGYHAVVAGEAARPDPDRIARRVAVAAALTAPVLVTSMAGIEAGWIGWLGLALTTPVVGWCAWPLHRATWRNLRQATASMDTLISIGSLTAWGASVVGVIAGGDLYFEVAGAVVTLILLGRLLEARAKERAGGAVGALLDLTPRTATIPGPDGERSIPAAHLVIGDVFVLRPGERVATDGVVTAGASTIDESMLTGESVPREVAPGDQIAGGTLNVDGRVEVRANRVGADTALAGIQRLVREAQAGKAAVQRLADRVAAIFVPAVLVVAAATYVAWLAAGASQGRALTCAVAVLIIACPCALGLATPTALLVGTGRGAQLGLLIRGPAVLESTDRIDTIVLDKTGTVTTGVMAVVGCDAEGLEPGVVLRLAGAVEHASEHPIGRAIADAARAAEGEPGAVSAFQAHAGLGVSGVVDGRRVEVGRHPVDGALGEALGRATAAGRTAVTVIVDGIPRGVIVVADVIRPTSREAVDDLRRLGLHPILVTGDAEATARAVAQEVGIEDVFAGVSPEGKVDVVRTLQAAGHVVAVVGDGVNDAPALAQATIGLAIGAGTDAAIEASDITLTGSDLRAVGDAIRLARRTLRTIRMNLFWAFAYNVAAIPLAAAGELQPMIAAGAMAASSLLVVGNSLRLRRFSVNRAGAAPASG
jgi:Cu+-exporting ATPase